MLVSLNIEREILPKQVIHEIIHLKWPKEIPQEKIHHEMIDEMDEEVRKLLNLPLKAPIFEIPSLKEERSKILKIFKDFDEALGKIIFSEQKVDPKSTMKTKCE